MNWKNLFIAGLVLGLSPFTMRLDHTIFLYSLLGYGLCALSYLFKDRDNYWDYLVISDLILVIAAGLFNYFRFYILFQYIFLGLLFASYADSEKGSPARFISLPMIFFTGALLVLYIGGLSGFLGNFNMAVFLFYFMYFMAGAIVVAGYRQPPHNFDKR